MFGFLMECGGLLRGLLEGGFHISWILAQEFASCNSVEMGEVEGHLVALAAYFLEEKRASAEWAECIVVRDVQLQAVA